MRIDPVDLHKWAGSTPWYKVAGAVAVSGLCASIGKPIGFVCDRLIELVNLLRRAETAVSRWSGFIPIVLDEADAPGDIYTAQLMGPHGRLCVFCHDETTESMRTHVRCWRQWSAVADDALRELSRGEVTPADFPGTLKE